LIQRTKGIGGLRSISICRGTPPVSHLLFVDDYFPFFKVGENQAQVMQNILTMDEHAPWQTTNLPKSKIFYSGHVSDSCKHFITSAVGI